eukprot:2748055-Amphidinium_carterae.1
MWCFCAGLPGRTEHCEQRARVLIQGVNNHGAHARACLPDSLQLPSTLLVSLVQVCCISLLLASNPLVRVSTYLYTTLPT